MRFALAVTILVLAVGTQPGAFGDAAVIRVGSGEPVNRMLFGMNHDWVGGNRVPGRPDLQAAVKYLGLGVVRYPGGTNSSFWDMLQGRFVPDDLIRSVGVKDWTARYVPFSRNLSKLPADALSARAFSEFCRSTGSEPLWVLNGVTETQAQGMKSVELIASLSPRPPHIEMGNEIEMAVFRKLVPTAGDYLNSSKPVIEHIRKVAPGAKIGMAASMHAIVGQPLKTLKGDRDERDEKWNDTLFGSRALYDAWILHSYVLGPHYLATRKPEQWPSAALALPETQLDIVAERCRKDYNSIPIWLTEYNAPFQQLTKKGPTVASGFYGDMRNSPLHALFIAGYLMAVVENSDIFKIACYHSVSGMNGFGVVQLSEGDGSKPPSINATAQLFAELAAIVRGSEKMHKVTITDNPPMDLEIMGRTDLQALQAVAFSSNDGLSVLVLNRSGKAAPYEVPLSGEYKSGSCTVYAAGAVPKAAPWEPLGGEQKPFPPVVENLKLSGTSVQGVAPAYSLSIVRLAKSE